MAAITCLASNNTDKFAVDMGAANSSTANIAPLATAGNAGTANGRKSPTNSVYAATHVTSEASARTLRTRTRIDVARV
jgi:hypothetical protein